jgi:Flagellar assembly protein FliH
VSAEFVSLAELLRAAAAESLAREAACGVSAEPCADATVTTEAPIGANADPRTANADPRTANAVAEDSDALAAARPRGGTPARNRHIVSVDDVESFGGIASLEEVPPLDDADVIAGALRDARLFRARLADAFDDAAARLVRELAADVLARELRLAPAEIGTLVRRVLERAPVIRVRVAPADVGFIRGVPVLADPALAPGDAIIELGRGELDVRLGVRLSAVLEAFT